MPRSFYLSNLFLLIGLTLWSQSLQVTNLRAESNGRISFDYQINPHHSDREVYKLELYSSVDQFRTPLKVDLAPAPVGRTNKASFNGPAVIGNYSGDIQFKFKVTAVEFPVEITSTPSKFKSGKTITVSWTDFHDSGWYDVELYKNGSLVQALAGSHRGTTFSTQLPKKMEKGTYQIRVTPSNEKKLYSEDYSVAIGGGSPVLMIVGGAAAGAGVFVLTAGGGDSAPGGGGTGSTGLPDPPTPGGG